MAKGTKRRRPSGPSSGRTGRTSTPTGKARDGDAEDEGVDLADVLGLAPRDRAALAPNWRSPLRVDLCIGLGVVLLGISMLTAGRVALGAVMAVAGAAYAGLVVRRWRSWADIRRRAGLS